MKYETLVVVSCDSSLLMRMRRTNSKTQPGFCVGGGLSLKAQAVDNSIFFRHPEDSALL